MEFEDRTLACEDCGNDFTFTAGEQEFFHTKGFENEPKRCKECRNNRKRQRRGQRQSFNVTCAACGADATVPFKPKEGVPVYCKDCYEKSKE